MEIPATITGAATGATVGATAADGVPQLPARWRWIWFVATLAIGAAGTIAVLAQPDDHTGTDSVESSTQTFDIDPAYSGPVWFTIDAPADRTVHVVVDWVEWVAEFDVAPEDPHTWWMLKRDPGDSPPVAFVLSPAGEVSVGVNTVPAKSKRVPDDAWRQQAPAPSGG